MFLDFKETEQSKILPNKAFGYWKVTVERPSRLSIELSDGGCDRFRAACEEAKEGPLANLVFAVGARIGRGPFHDFNKFRTELEDEAERRNVKLTPKRMKLVQSALAQRNEKAEPVISRVHKSGKAEPDPLHGIYEGMVKSTKCVVEYEPDSELRDTEQIPLLEEGGIEAFIRREVLPYAPDAWVNADQTEIGYEISFTRYFYKPQPLRSLEEIRAEIVAVESEAAGLLSEIIGVPVR